MLFPTVIFFSAFSESSKIIILQFVFILNFSILLFHSSSAQPGTWVAVYGGDQYDRGRGLAQTVDNGYIVCGTTTSYGIGNTDFYLLKIDSVGKYQWQNTFGGINIENAFSVKHTADSGFIICGYTNSFGLGGYDSYLVKTDSQGNFQWQKTYGSSDWDFAYWAEQTNDGGYVLCGETYSYGNNAQAYLVKTDSNGDTLWTRVFGQPNEDAFKEVHQTSDNGYILAGYSSSDVGDKEFYILKTDSAGNKQWEKFFGGTGNDQINSTTICADGNFLFGGSYENSGVSKIFFMKTNSSGGILLSVVDTPSTGAKSVTRIRETFDGQFVTLINSSVGGFGGQEIFLDKWNGQWNQWVRTFGGTYDEEGYDLVQTKDSGFALVGYTETFGKGPDNIFIVKTASDGNYISTTNSYVSVNDLTSEENDIVIYPNPSNGIFFVQTGSSQVKNIRAYNIVGSEVFSTERSQSFTEIDLRNQPEGIYLIEILLKKGIARKKIIIAK